MVGEMIPGSRARILDQSGNDYLVASPLDGSEGWIARLQVAREVMQDPATNRICESGTSRSNGEIICPDGSVYYGNNPDRACK